MPTYNRRPFVPHAIEYFLRQNYENRELIVVDDGTDSISDLIPQDRRIRYTRLENKLTLGAKLNLACEMAEGEIIAHWDDDDWYAARRLSYQITGLAQKGIEVCGINQLLYYDLCKGSAYLYRYPRQQRMWLLGSELCYFRTFWRTHRFADINVGMDAQFVWSAAPESVLALEDPSFAVHMIHAHNVSLKQTQGPYWRPCSVEEIEKVMGTDWRFYKYRKGSNSGYPRPRTPESMTTVTTDTRDVTPARQVCPVRNVFACLVHESYECIIDLVRNLKCLDPNSAIILYNGGTNAALLNQGFSFERYGVVVHPSPRAMKWGLLHQFALECMQFALEHLSFDTLTIVDSDQLGVRSGYSEYLGR